MQNYSRKNVCISMNKITGRTSIISIKNMKCLICVNNITTILTKERGVISVRSNLLLKQVKVVYNEFETNLLLLITALEQGGFKCGTSRFRWYFLFIFTSISRITALATFNMIHNVGVNLLLGLPDQFHIYVKIRRSSQVGQVDKLLLVGSTLSYIFGAILCICGAEEIIQTQEMISTSSYIVLFVVFGKFLEEKIRNENSSFLEEIALKVDYMDLIFHGNDHTISSFQQSNEFVSIKSQNIHKGDIILIKRNCLIPADGKIYKGRAYIDESEITGEFRPKCKERDATIYAGTKNMGGDFLLRVTNVGTDTYFGKILGLVENSLFLEQFKFRRSENLLKHFRNLVFSGGIVLFSVYFALGILRIPRFLYSSENFTIFNLIIPLRISFSFIILACPCAFSIALPLIFMFGSRNFIKKGILIKEISAIESKISILFLDKTGTLTEGNFRVAKFEVLNNFNSEFILSIIKTVENEVDHPIGRCLFKYATNSLGFQLKDTKYISGLGIDATVVVPYSFNKDFIFCSNKFKEFIKSEATDIENQNNSITCPDKDNEISMGLHVKIGSEVHVGLPEIITDNYQRDIYLSINSIVACKLILKDQIRSEAYDCISKIKSMKIICVMLTSDNAENAKKVCDELKIEKFHCNLTAKQKLEIVRSYKSTVKVGMVGDGINDCPALKCADIGISISKLNSAANVVLIHPNLSLIPEFLKKSAEIRKRIRINYLFAGGYNFMMLPYAAVIFIPFEAMISPKIACMCMALSSISVFISSFTLSG